MFNAFTHYTIWVTDQDEALDFYVGKLGLELHTDIKLDTMRWVTVCVPGHPDQQIILAALDPPIIDAENAERARDLLSKGYVGNFILSSSDCRADYRMLLASGVEFTQEPVEQTYGIDCSARDPFGNQIRIAQRALPPTL